MPIITLANGKQFSAEASETMLDAALRAGVVLEHSCKTGRCGSCKTQLHGGSSIPLVDEIGLSQAEREAGWILTCARCATSDVQLDVEDLGGIKVYPAKTLPCRIQSLERLGADVLRVILRLPPNQQLDYHPGQYIDVIGKGGLRRSYSLANASAAEKLLELHIRAVSGGAMSEYWFGQAKVNDLLRLNGPLGTFFLRNVVGLDLVFLATGTGMAPVKAMLEGIDSLSPECRPRSVSVYWGARAPGDLYWDVSSVGAAHRYTPVLSRAGRGWSGAQGHVQEVLMASQPNLSETVVYACGSDAMIHSAKEMLLKAGLPERWFLSDAFVCSAVS
ncbi:MAG: 2Fe-2S iron-sulfur cluster binding domain-containing protein [Gammaproteobacteria bacterium]|nr:2Fe-2S iron-sulfur cluster binding domain-containing protein [Gammaproteobacteria bacterium]MBU1406946.1 2Fe-2S iron-sulfur cluster binding domain-containing protein [Gammaproteobacteria bacterium]MBU1533089.1 2Fe-2S iron-sulfur cluster binding domain-containing protein [Gammaproteobacteria bacterium]